MFKSQALLALPVKSESPKFATALLYQKVITALTQCCSAWPCMNHPLSIFCRIGFYRLCISRIVVKIYSSLPSRSCDSIDIGIGSFEVVRTLTGITHAKGCMEYCSCYSCPRKTNSNIIQHPNSSIALIQWNMSIAASKTSKAPSSFLLLLQELEEVRKKCQVIVPFSHRKHIVVSCVPFHHCLLVMTFKYGIIISCFLETTTIPSPLLV